MNEHEWVQRSEACWEYCQRADSGAIRRAPAARVEKSGSLGWNWHIGTRRLSRHLSEDGWQPTREEAQREVECLLAPILGPEMGDDARELGRAGYEAYTKHTAQRPGFDCREPPSWQELTDHMKGAWSKAGLAMMSEAERQLGARDD